MKINKSSLQYLLTANYSLKNCAIILGAKYKAVCAAKSQSNFIPSNRFFTEDQVAAKRVIDKFLECRDLPLQNSFCETDAIYIYILSFLGVNKDKIFYMYRCADKKFVGMAARGNLTKDIESFDCSLLGIDEEDFKIFLRHCAEI